MLPTKLLWKLLIIIHLCAVLGGSQFIRTPLNTAVVVGQRLELVCQPDNHFTVREWKGERLEGSASPIYGNWRQPRIEDKRFGFEIDNNGSVVIYLNSTNLTDSGFYICDIHAGTQQPRQSNAHVIVFETDPICEDNMTTAFNVTLEEGSIVWIRCNLNFRGNLTPTMEWRQHGGSGEIDEEGHVLTGMVETTVIADANISSTLSIVINSTNNGTFFSCKTYFQWDNASSQSFTATNAPEYSYTWNSSVIIVSAKTYAQEETTEVRVSTSVTTSTTNGLSSTLNASSAVYLVASVAVLFGIASSLVAIILCLHLRRKNSGAVAMNIPIESAYDMIPYAIEDTYDTIEEVDEKDYNMFPNFPPRHGPLPEPGYAPLTPDEPNPPGVYSRMDRPILEVSVEDISLDVDEKNLPSDIHGSTCDRPRLSAVEKPALNKIPGNGFLASTTAIVEDFATTDHNMQSPYMTLTDDPLQESIYCNDDATITGEKITPIYLETAALQQSLP